MKLSTAEATDRCFDKCNLIGEDVDIYEQMRKFKTLSNLPIAQWESVYDHIAERMGFLNV